MSSGSRNLALGISAVLVPFGMLVVARALMSSVSRSAAHLFYMGALFVLGVLSLLPDAVHRWGARWAPVAALAIASAVASVAWARRSRW